MSQTLTVRGLTEVLLSLESDFKQLKTALILFNRNITKEKHDNNHKKNVQKLSFLHVSNNFYDIISSKQGLKFNHVQ